MPNHTRWSDPTARTAIESLEPEPEPHEEQPRGLAHVRQHPDPPPPGLVRHLMVLLKYGFDITDPDVIERARRIALAEEERHQEAVAALTREAQYVAWQQAGAVTSYVYYIRLGNRVKIGFSTNLRNRLDTIGGEELLAVEPGGREQERLRHVEFRHLHSHREWFRYEEPLISHIERLRAAV